ncbi:energy transducer TonB [Flavobacterium sp. XGLA_31]|uniref:energy transducer TonB n=1 Tax=Flavobacterium sp. XGLA_31 TaxID=3447666 RepID=UPI003F33C08D
MLFSQIVGEDEVYLNGERIEAKFNGGGIENFTEFVHREFDYSKVTKPGKLEATFTIDENGDVKNIKITQILDIESATEFIRVLKKCPKWEPAMRNGKPISIDIKYPMVFKEKKKTGVTQMQPKPESIGDSNLLTTTEVEKAPRFPNGIAGFYKYISANYNVPRDKNFKGGKVYVTFIIEKDGAVTEVKVIRDCGFGTGEEAKRVLSLSPKWLPGEQKGIPVRVQYSLPITLPSN